MMDIRFFAVAAPEGETYINMAHVTALGKVRPRAAFGEKNAFWAIEMRFLGASPATQARSEAGIMGDTKFEPIGYFASEDDAEIRLGDLIKAALSIHARSSFS
jgi:hypothetical protein